MIQELDILRQRVADLEQSKLAHKRAEEELRESKKILEDIVEGISDGVLFLSQDLKVIWANKAALKQSGYSIEEMKGRYCYSITHNREKPCQPPNDTCPVEEAMKTGNSVAKSHTHVNKAGDNFFTEVSVYPIQNEKGEIVRFVHFSRDITDRIKAEESLQKSEETAQRLAEENAIMAEIGRTIGSTLDIQEVYERFAEEVRKVILFDRIVVNIINPKDYTATRSYVAGIEVTDRGRREIFPLAGTFTEEVVRSRKGLLIPTEDLENLMSRFLRFLSTFQAGVRSMISVPLISRNEVIGVLHIRSTKPNTYSESDLSLAERVGRQIAGAIANTQLFVKLTQAKEEQEKLVHELEDALAKVKTLSGFIPICASCKKIRDDQGYWNQIEGYIRDHSEAEFTHSMCPECMKKLYPDFAQDEE